MDKPNGLENLKKTYEKLNYFDQYGGSLIMIIIITSILIVIISYCYAMINSQPIKDDWPNQRCKPQYLPIAGFITHPEGVTATEYTAENFTYCVQNILTDVTGVAVQPLTFIVNSIQNLANIVIESINSIRAMFDKIRTAAQSVAQEILGRIMNVMIPLQQIIISFKDLVGKIQGTMTAGLFTFLGSYYALKSMMGAIAQFIVTILVALAVTIAVLWAIPFTWGAAAVQTGIFLAISIPMIVILAFMSDKLNIKGYKIPKVKCFDKNTSILMNDGNTKIIKDIVVGDVLCNNNIVTSKIIVETEGSTMYNLYNIIVSDSHIVNYLDNWIPVSQHPHAKIYSNYLEPYLYCLNTSSKTIQINEHVFSDWDEIFDNDIKNIQNNSNFIFYERNDIHKYMDSGFIGNTEIKLNNGNTKCIKNICVGDVLENNESVYGIVEIDGTTLSAQYKHHFDNKTFEGGPNLTLCGKNINFWSTIHLAEKYNGCLDNKLNFKQKKDKKEDKLYHLLTDKKTFYVNNVKFYDYNASIDLFLDKNRGKLLSMKYV
jgi:hypothetical protein